MLDQVADSQCIAPIRKMSKIRRETGHTLPHSAFPLAHRAPATTTRHLGTHGVLCRIMGVVSEARVEIRYRASLEFPQKLNETWKGDSEMSLQKNIEQNEIDDPFFKTNEMHGNQCS